MNFTYPKLVVAMVASLITSASQCIETRTYPADGGVCGVVCPSARPHCEPTSMTCVACLVDDDCGGTKPTCDTSTHTCIACTGNADCVGSTTGSICEVASGACRTCVNDGECATNVGATVCRESTGRCVACTPDAEATTCGANSCSRTTFTCTGTARGSVGTCRHCQGDSECGAGDHCVPITYQGTSLGNYCMHDSVGGVCGSIGTNPTLLPYWVLRTLTSVDGTQTQTCGLRDGISCEGVLGAGAPCTLSSGTSALDPSCGNPAVNDGVCGRPSGATSDTCHYRCVDSSDCKSSAACNGATPSFCE